MIPDQFDLIAQAIRIFVERFGIGFEPTNAEINFDAGAVILMNDQHICGIVFDDDVDICELSDDDLAFRAKCRPEWDYPEFEEILKRAGIDSAEIDDGEQFEQAIDTACKKLEVDVFLPEF